MELIEIVSQRKIRHITESVAEKFRTIIYSAVFTKGVYTTPKDAAAMAQILERDIRRKYPNLTLEEVSYAVEQGIRGEYGEYYGINNVSLLNFVKAYATSEERAKAVSNHNLKQLPAKTTVSDQEKINIIKTGIINKFHQFMKTGVLNDWGNPSYDFLAKAGYINYSEEQRSEFKKLAAKRLIAEETIRRSSLNYDIRQDEIKAIEEFKNNTKHKRIIAEGKRLALKDYFLSLINQGLSIENIIN